MKIKYKFLVGMFIITMLVLSSGITYSIFNSGATLTGNQEIAKFIFNTEQLDHIDVPLIDMNPGDTKEYSFAVSNTSSNNFSNVSVEYEIAIKTYHFIPLEITLYRINTEGVKEATMICDELTYSRNTINELVCNSEIQTMNHGTEELDNYILELAFPTEYNDVVYSNLVDYISLDITSWQKIENK